MPEPIQWSPLKKWVMTVVGGILISVFLMVIVSVLRAMQERIEIRMRIEALEDHEFPATFPPTETQIAIANIEHQLQRIDEKIETISDQLNEHRHYTPTDPGVNPYGHYPLGEPLR